MKVKLLQVGPLGTNCYLLVDETTNKAAVVDPGGDAERIQAALEQMGVELEYILLTHGHYDHTTAVNAVHEQTGATVCIHAADANADMENAPYRFSPPAGTVYYKEGDEFEVGSLKFTVYETPGHSPGCVCLLCGDSLFTGDTLFRDSCGRTDLPGGDMPTLLRSLKKICDLPGNLDVYPGHMDATTLDRERRFNYYVKYAYEVLG